MARHVFTKEERSRGNRAAKKHPFTTDECKRGGWVRADQKAAERFANPSPLEKEVIDILDQLGIQYLREYKIWNAAAGFPQYFDFYLSETRTAIEADGGHDWHGNFDSSKMRKYDDAKEAYCKANGIRLIRIESYNVSELPALLSGKQQEPTKPQPIDF